MNKKEYVKPAITLVPVMVESNILRGSTWEVLGKENDAVVEEDEDDEANGSSESTNSKGKSSFHKKYSTFSDK